MKQMEPVADGSGAPSAAELAYIEDVALFFEQGGLPRMAGRIVGWLLICDPPEQSSGDLVRVLGASKGSISTATRLLVQYRLIERVSLPGRRRDYFRIRPGAWAELVRVRVAALTDFRRLTERGLGLLAGADPRRRERLQDIHELYLWLERELATLLERWDRDH